MTAFALSFSVATAQTGKLVKNPVPANFGSVKSGMLKQPAKAQLEEGQMLIGAYTSDDYEGNALGLRSTGNIELVSKIDISRVMRFSGSKLVAIRYALANATTVSNVVAYIAKGNKYTEIANTKVTGTSVVGWNTVQLETPANLDFSDADALCLGFKYTQKSGAYPLAFVNSDYEAPTYQHSGTSFSDTQADAAGYGTLCVQGIVEDVIMPEKNIVLEAFSIEKYYQKAGNELKYAVKLYNFGSQAVENVVLATYFDGVETAQPLTVTNVTTQEQIVEGSVTVPTDIENGTHLFKVAVKTVDGAAPTTDLEDDELTANFIAYANEVPRQKNLVEQFTAQNCGYCPSGAKNLKNFLDTREDESVWVAIHGKGMGADIFATDYADYLEYVEGVTGYPSASFNRANVTGSPAFVISFGSSVTTSQINEYFGQIMDISRMVPSFANINITANYDYNTRKLDVTVKGNAAEGAKSCLEGMGLTVFLTEDGLIAKQSNGGNKYQHDHTLRESLTSCLGSELNWNGESYENTYSITLKNDYTPENMNVVAFISPMVTNVQAYKGEPLDVNNAESLSLKDIVAAGISGTTSDNNSAVETTRYNAAGQVISAPQAGLNIVKMSDGTTRKVIVK